MEQADLLTAFPALFGREPDTLARAPGRVNLIGEHVDYNYGLVLPMAIDRYCRVAAAPRADNVLRTHSAELDETVEIGIGREVPEQHHWSDYVAGVAWSLQRARKRIGGADLLITSDIPPGAGLSSSAAIEVATAAALLDLYDEHLDPTDVALVCQRAENEYAGARVGIMDQLTSCMGVAGQALLIDCRSLEVDTVPMDESEVTVVVANTMVKHELAAGEYNRRREKCEHATSLIRQAHPEVRSLRDVVWPLIENESRDWPEELRRRARHVTTEIQRVELAAKALRSRSYAEFGRLMDESHASLDSDYEVSCPELNTMARIARELGAYGARMTGGGFGGCVVSLIEAEGASAFQKDLAASYQGETAIEADLYAVRSADGALRVS